MDISVPFVSLAIGKAGSGKSNLIKYILAHFQTTNTFKIVLVFSKTAFNDAYDYVPVQWVHTGYNQNAIKNIMNIQARVKSAGFEPVNVLLVFDDCLSTSVYNSEFFTDLIANRRHYNISIIFATQYINRQVPTIMRENTDLVHCFKQHSRNSLDAIFSAWGVCFNDVNEFNSIMKNLERFQFLEIDIRKYDNNKRVMITPRPESIPSPKVIYSRTYPM